MPLLSTAVGSRRSGGCARSVQSRQLSCVIVYIVKDVSRREPARSRRQPSSTRDAGSRVGIRRVAEEAGVSTATVSRALSGRGPVGDATRDRVMRAAERLRYLPSAAARSLRTDRTMVVGVIVPDLANPVFVPFLRGVEHVAQSCGYAVLVVDAQRSVEIERRALDRFLAQGVDALVLAGPVRDKARIGEMLSAGIVVVADGGGESGFPLVAQLERPGTLAMCDTLADLGHRCLGYVSRDRALSETGGRRWRCITERCESLGIRPERVALRGNEPQEVAAELSAVLRRREPVTALVSSAHRLVPQLLLGLRAAGVAFPEECSLVTYGDSEWAAAHHPSISVVTLDLYEVAAALTSSALSRLTGDRAVGEGAFPREARFVRRESIGPRPAR
jgi:LacI family transcriptional regulator